MTICLCHGMRAQYPLRMAPSWSKATSPGTYLYFSDISSCLSYESV